MDTETKTLIELAINLMAGNTALIDFSIVMCRCFLLQNHLDPHLTRIEVAASLALACACNGAL